MQCGSLILATPCTPPLAAHNCSIRGYANKGSARSFLTAATGFLYMDCSTLPPEEAVKALDQAVTAIHRSLAPGRDYSNPGHYMAIFGRVSAQYMMAALQEARTNGAGNGGNGAGRGNGGGGKGGGGRAGRGGAGKGGGKGGAHVAHAAAVPAQPAPVAAPQPVAQAAKCIDFANGRCQRGVNCRYAH
jgi:hypothetical protein